MSSRKVIVFGPTGAVGSAAARTAHELGASVVLAMRDTTKAIPGLDADTEKSGNYERVRADLTLPDSVRDAIQHTGAKYAFLYLAHAMPDHMKSTIQALKSAGIELVVFNSSFTVQGDPQAVESRDLIPFLHAQVEMNLLEVFGADGFVAARPGSFASNNVQFKTGVHEGHVRIFAPDTTVDCIVPEDIGRVCGTILAKGPQDDQRAIYLYGAHLMSQADAVRVVAKVLGKNVRIESMNGDDAFKMFTQDHKLPEPLAQFFIRQSIKSRPDTLDVFGYPVTQEQLSNVHRYSGKPATTFERWVEQNREKFEA